jgi:hypothetical protein
MAPSSRRLREKDGVSFLEIIKEKLSWRVQDPFQRSMMPIVQKPEHA